MFTRSVMDYGDAALLDYAVASASSAAASAANLSDAVVALVARIGEIEQRGWNPERRDYAMRCYALALALSEKANTFYDAAMDASDAVRAIVQPPASASLVRAQLSLALIHGADAERVARHAVRRLDTALSRGSSLVGV